MQLSLGRYFREEENTGKKYLYDLFYFNNWILIII